MLARLLAGKTTLVVLKIRLASIQQPLLQGLLPPRVVVLLRRALQSTLALAHPPHQAQAQVTAAAAAAVAALRELPV